MTATGLCLLVALLAVSAPAADAPADGLRVGRVTIVTRDIFSPAEVDAVEGPERLLRRAMNGLHANTRDRVLRRELLFAPGEPYDPARLAETERALRRLGLHNEVRVTATDTLPDGTVDVLVSVRESWSLQATFGFSLASGGDNRWNLQLSERNFLGTAVTVGAGVGADEDRSFWNLWYRKRRLFGSALALGLDWSESADGHRRSVYVQRDFHAEDDPWGGGVQAYDTLGEVRWYLSNAGPAGADPARPASLYAKLPRRLRGGEASALVRVNGADADQLWRLGAGLRVTHTDFHVPTRALLSDGRVADLGWLEAPGGPAARVEGREVYPYLVVQSVGRDWTEERFVLQYGPVEDVLRAPSLELRFGPSGGQTGSTTGFGRDLWRAEGSVRHWFGAGPALAVVSAAGYAEAGDRDARRHRGALVAGAVARAGAVRTPWLLRAFAEAAHGDGLDGTEAFRLGLDRGLRTLDFDGMAGDRLVRWNVEAGKVSPWEVLGLFRTGAAVFYDGGRAWWDDETAGAGDDVRHEAGFGLRFGPVRSTNADIARLDVSWALDGSEGPVVTAISRGWF